jgi:hypothetical protein
MLQPQVVPYLMDVHHWVLQRKSVAVTGSQGAELTQPSSKLSAQRRGALQVVCV